MFVEMLPSEVIKLIFLGCMLNRDCNDCICGSAFGSSPYKEIMSLKTQLD